MAKAEVKVNSTLNVRKYPSTTSTILGKLANGAIVDVLEAVPGSNCGSSWGRINYKGGNGYICLDYVLEVDEDEDASDEITDPSVFIPDSPAAITTTGSPATTIDYNGYAVEGGYVSSRSSYSNSVLSTYLSSGYSKAKMSIATVVLGVLVNYHFAFLVGPSAMTEDLNNMVTPIKTGGGFFIQRGGPGLSRLTLSGAFLDYKGVDERRNFLEGYYRKYLVDKVNAFHDYFNESKLTIELMGFKYHCILTDLQLSQTPESLFTFRYNMSLLVLNTEIMGTLRKPDKQSLLSGNSIVIDRMKHNSTSWWSASDDERTLLVNENRLLGASIGALYNSRTGVWDYSGVTISGSVPPIMSSL